MARAMTQQGPVRDSPEGVILTVHVQPKAARTEFAGVHGEALKFRVAASPVEGAANETLCVFLAERFGLPRRAVEVRAGHGARHKRILVKGVPAGRVREILGLPRSPIA